MAEACRVLRPDSRIINICDMPIDLMDKMARMCGIADRRELQYSYYGLNHYGWFTRIYDKDGNDLMPQIKEHMARSGYLDGIEHEEGKAQHVEESWVQTLGKAKDCGFEADAHATYIVDLACALAMNAMERFLLIVPNDGAVSNFDETAMVEVPCIAGKNGYEKICQGKVPQWQKGMLEQQVSVEKLVVQA